MLLDMMLGFRRVAVMEHRAKMSEVCALPLSLWLCLSLVCWCVLWWVINLPSLPGNPFHRAYPHLCVRDVDNVKLSIILILPMFAVGRCLGGR